MHLRVKTKVQILHFLQPRKVQKSPQVVKHVVKCEKWAYSTPKAGKNKPIDYIMKTRDFARICEINKENRESFDSRFLV